MQTIVAVDTSYSTRGNPDYYKDVQNILEEHPGAILISWNTKAKFVKKANFFSFENAYGCTEFHECLKLLKTVNYKFHLIVTTDGQVYDETLCEDIMQKSTLNEKIEKIDIYFIGNENSMNTKISAIFGDLPRSGYINGVLIGEAKPNFQVQEVQIEDILDDREFKNLMFEISSKKNIDKGELCLKLKKLETQLLNEYANEATDKLNSLLTKYFFEENHEECANFIKKKYSLYIIDKKIIQSKIQRLINMLTDSKKMYDLENFKPYNEISFSDIKDETNTPVLEETNFNINCDILYEKCANVCMLIKDFVDESDSILKTNFKKFAECPFELLNHEDLLVKLSQSVEYYKIDLITYEKLQNKHTSPFTRDKLKGVYIFHNSNTDFEKLVLNNSRSISILFGSGNKLPGNRYVWNIVFLYAMSKFHPVWKKKQYTELLLNEIKYIGENATVYISLSSLINPNIKTKLNIALWYCVNVSPLAFPNSIKNRIRAIGMSLYKFYSDIYEVPKAVSLDLLNTWILWKYFVHQSDKMENLKSEVLSQFFQQEKVNENYIFITNFVKNRCGFLKQFNKELILKTFFSFIQKTHSASLYDEIVPIENIENVIETKKWLNNLKFEVQDRDFKEALEEMSHVKINLKTLHPFVICPITHEHWKKCANTYDISSESYIRLFQKYCYRFKKYPSSANDLIVFHSKKNFIIYQKSLIFPAINKVMDIFKDVMQMFSCEKYIEMTKMYFSERSRLENE